MANVGEMDAASVAMVRLEFADFGVRMGLGAQSGIMVVLDCGFGTRARFAGTGSGPWVVFVSTGFVKHATVMVTSSGSWGKCICIASVAWVKFVVTGIED